MRDRGAPPLAPPRGRCPSSPRRAGPVKREKKKITFVFSFEPTEGSGTPQKGNAMGDLSCRRSHELRQHAAVAIYAQSKPCIGRRNKGSGIVGVSH